MVAVYMPLYNDIGGSETVAIEIARCNALPTKAETLVCLDKVKEHQEAVDQMFGVFLVCVLLAMIVIAWVTFKT